MAGAVHPVLDKGAGHVLVSREGKTQGPPASTAVLLGGYSVELMDVFAQSVCIRPVRTIGPAVVSRGQGTVSGAPTQDRMAIPMPGHHRAMPPGDLRDSLVVNARRKDDCGALLICVVQDPSLNAIRSQRDTAWIARRARGPRRDRGPKRARGGRSNARQKSRRRRNLPLVD